MEMFFLEMCTKHDRMFLGVSGIINNTQPKLSFQQKIRFSGLKHKWRIKSRSFLSLYIYICIHNRLTVHSSALCICIEIVKPYLIIWLVMKLANCICVLLVLHQLIFTVAMQQEDSVERKRLDDSTEQLNVNG